MLIEGSTANILDNLIFKSKSLGIHLLQDDKRWLKKICLGINRSLLVSYLNEYIERWLNAMEQEPVIYKKQNAGRRTANTWIRETLKIKHTKY